MLGQLVSCTLRPNFATLNGFQDENLHLGTLNSTSYSPFCIQVQKVLVLVYQESNTHQVVKILNPGLPPPYYLPKYPILQSIVLHATYLPTYVRTQTCVFVIFSSPFNANRNIFWKEQHLRLKRITCLNGVSLFLSHILSPLLPI